jgi:hypothetical protein
MGGAVRCSALLCVCACACMCPGACRRATALPSPALPCPAPHPLRIRSLSRPAPAGPAPLSPRFPLHTHAYAPVADDGVLLAAGGVVHVVVGHLVVAPKQVVRHLVQHQHLGGGGATQGLLLRTPALAGAGPHTDGCWPSQPARQNGPGSRQPPGACTCRQATSQGQAARPAQAPGAEQACQGTQSPPPPPPLAQAAAAHLVCQLAVLEDVELPALVGHARLGGRLELEHHAVDRVALRGQLAREAQVGRGHVGCGWRRAEVWARVRPPGETGAAISLV